MGRFAPESQLVYNRSIYLWIAIGKLERKRIWTYQRLGMLDAMPDIVTDYRERIGVILTLNHKVNANYYLRLIFTG
jgi:hypothetical protein